jgi:hypothetical protein
MGGLLISRMRWGMGDKQVCPICGTIDLRSTFYGNVEARPAASSSLTLKDVVGGVAA